MLRTSTVQDTAKVFGKDRRKKPSVDTAVHFPVFGCIQKLLELLILLFFCMIMVAGFSFPAERNGQHWGVHHCAEKHYISNSKRLEV
eukprot:2899792-Amphidinium_carterae.1